MRSTVLGIVLGILFGGLLGSVILVGTDRALAAQTYQAEWGYESSEDFWYKLMGEDPFDLFVIIERHITTENPAKTKTFRIKHVIPCSEVYKLQIITWVIGEDLGKRIACDESVSYIDIPKDWEKSLRPFPEEVEKVLRAKKIPEGSLRT